MRAPLVNKSKGTGWKEGRPKADRRQSQSSAGAPGRGVVGADGRVRLESACRPAPRSPGRHRGLMKAAVAPAAGGRTAVGALGARRRRGEG